MAVTSSAAERTDSPGLLKGVLDHFAGRAGVIVGLVCVALLVYGFELFNFNLTIDEEVHAASVDASQWVSQGRWGMYVLNRILLPYPVVPVVPLAVGLTLHFLGVLVLLKAWEVVDATEQFLVGALAIATPTMAYMYTFATIGYGMGAGLLATALSLAMFHRATGARRYWAAVPAAFALAIYQTFGLALICVFVVSLVRSRLTGVLRPRHELLHMAGVGAAAIGGYLAGQAAFMVTLHEPRSDYLEQFINLDALRDHPKVVIENVARAAWRVYRGDDSVFAHAAWALPVLLVMLAAVFAWRTATSGHRRITRAALVIAFPLVVAAPFLGGLLSGGYVALRFLVALPFALAGLMALGLPRHRLPRATVIVTAGLLLLQFATATNSLFGASHLALVQDRALGAQLINAIEIEMSEASTTPRYLEVVGVPSRTASELIPRSETFGASFFEWDGGNVFRVVLFLKTMGFDELSGLAPAQRAALVATASAMPDFPLPGSVVVEGDVVVVRFGAYTPPQVASICSHNPDVSVCDP